MAEEVTTRDPAETQE